MVLKVQMNCEKCRAQALRIAADTQGVTQMAIQGQEKDELMVTGEEVDSVKLTRCLRKKLHYATILTIEEIKEDKKIKPKNVQNGKGQKNDGKNNLPSHVFYPLYPMPPLVVFQDPYQYEACSIM
ncbi:hypothetical protein CXB51_010440 [Gossypium anomalum]|uniref:HMA domain-containing protein n=1 Tax=Gossypium anomalum TaxID=47600 RepID=A0A8J5Z2A6_9ROSI|nr:hypothetical protein CXB51_010440 [Gossypium anomalum]